MLSSWGFSSHTLLGTSGLLASPASSLEDMKPKESSGAHCHVVPWVLSFPALLSPDSSGSPHVCFLYHVKGFCLYFVGGVEKMFLLHHFGKSLILAVFRIFP